MFENIPYVRSLFGRYGVKLNFNHLQERIRELNGIEVNRDEFIKLLKEKIDTTDIKMVKQDVKPFIKNVGSMNIWSTDYFLKLTEMIVFE